MISVLQTWLAKILFHIYSYLRDGAFSCHRKIFDITLYHVILECPSGFHGHNCLERCSSNCEVPEICDKISGHCRGNCKEGWTGNMCNSGKKYHYLLITILEIYHIRGSKHKDDLKYRSLDIINLKKPLRSLHSYIYNHYSIVNIYYISYSLTVGAPRGSLITAVWTLIQYNNCVIILCSNRMCWWAVWPRLCSVMWPLFKQWAVPPHRRPLLQWLPTWVSGR